MQAGTQAEIDEIGFFKPAMTPAPAMDAGEVGYVITGIKDVTKLRVGDTLTATARPASEPLPGYREVKPMVFCGLFPIDTDRYEDLREALDRLSLNDAALSWEPRPPRRWASGSAAASSGSFTWTSSAAPRARIRPRPARDDAERGYEVELIGGEGRGAFAVDLPDPASISEIREPYIRASVICPADRVRGRHGLCQERRGTQLPTCTTSPGTRAASLRPAARGDRSRLLRPAQVAHRRLRIARLRADRAPRIRPVKLDILLAGEPVDALSVIVHRDKAYDAGKALVERLRRPFRASSSTCRCRRQIRSRVLARETVKALRKDVTAKLYGGDVTRSSSRSRRRARSG